MQFKGIENCKLQASSYVSIWRHQVRTKLPSDFVRDVSKVDQKLVLLRYY
jgi:hypothetical protein